MLEPYEWKRSRTVLRRESGSNPADLVDFGQLVK
ncbi:MAG: ABC transporter ATP-binding protein, partial [Bacillota bacterium]|nr:ABC transporter ATP-binding protein [Bacillota bacterium]